MSTTSSIISMPYSCFSRSGIRADGRDKMRTATPRPSVGRISEQALGRGWFEDETICEMRPRGMRNGQDALLLFPSVMGHQSSAPRQKEYMRIDSAWHPGKIVSALARCIHFCLQSGRLQNQTPDGLISVVLSTPCPSSFARGAGNYIALWNH